jgi:hypothetical protein
MIDRALFFTGIAVLTVITQYVSEVFCDWHDPNL